MNYSAYKQINKSYQNVKKEINLQLSKCHWKDLSKVIAILLYMVEMDREFVIIFMSARSNLCWIIKVGGFGELPRPFISMINLFYKKIFYSKPLNTTFEIF